MHHALELLFLMLAAHCLCDYALQGDFMSKAKDPNTDVGKSIWWMVLPSHGLIHGGAVFLITGSLFLGVAETIFHTAIDLRKCDKYISYKQDQALHVACKLLYLFWLSFS